MKPDLSVVYVNFNTTEVLIRSLESLRRHNGDVSYEAIVVDNGSEESPKGRLPEGTRLLEPGENLGFGKGNNLGAREAQGEILLILNTDAFICERTRVDQIVSFLREHPEVGAILPRLIDEFGWIQAGQVGYDPKLWRIVLDKPFKVLWRAEPLRALLRPLAALINLDFAIPERATEVEAATAAALFVRRDTFQKIGGFDEDFFMYLEDFDLCRRVRENGQRVEFHPEWEATHLLGQSIANNRHRKRLYFESQYLYFRKHSNFLVASVVRLFQLPYIAVMRLLGKGY